VVQVEEQGAGGNFSITIETPKDISMIVTDVAFRATPPAPAYANAVELLVPAVTYNVPLTAHQG
jgi:hypothetical protein